MGSWPWERENVVFYILSRVEGAEGQKHITSGKVNLPSGNLPLLACKSHPAHGNMGGLGGHYKVK